MSGLIARLNVERGRLGGHFAGGPHRHGDGGPTGGAGAAPGPERHRRARLGAGVLQRISNYLAASVKMRFPTVGAVEAYLRHDPRAVRPAHRRAVAATWPLHGAVDAGNGSLRLTHDPAIGKHFWLPMLLDLTLWQVWEKVACPTLILRGEDSDLLALETVRQMKQRGIAASRGLVQSAEIEGVRTRAGPDGGRARSPSSRISSMGPQWPPCQKRYRRRRDADEEKQSRDRRGSHRA